MGGGAGGESVGGVVIELEVLMVGEGWVSGAMTVEVEAGGRKGCGWAG
jgi:hypothetical protein